MRRVSRLVTVAVLAGVVAIATASVARAVQGRTRVEPELAGPVSLGVNIEGVTDWHPQHMFADLVKSSRYWFTTWPEAAPVDADGWPTGDAKLVVATPPGGYARPEPYALSFRGRATVTGAGVAVSNVAYDAPRNRTTASVVLLPNENAILIFSDTRRQPKDASPTGITDVKLVMPGHGPDELFSHPFLERLAPFSTLRFMQASGQAGTGSPANPDVDWADRAKPRRPQQTTNSGIAWEYVVLLANQVHKDVWINVPLGASDDYVRKLAQLFKYGSDGVNPYGAPQTNPVYPPLAPGLRIYVEYVNELWNGLYKSTHTNIALAEAEYAAGNPHGYTSGSGLAAGLQRQARRTKEISDAFRAVFGPAEMMTRVRPVFASQFGNWGTYDHGLQWAKAKYGPPGNYLYALAGAPYVTVEDENLDGMTVQQVLDQMDRHVHRRGGLNDQIDEFKALTARYDPRLKFVAYEGGAGNFAGHSDDAKRAAQVHPRMRGVVHDLVHHWYTAGGETFAYYTLCAGTGFGYFALTNDIADGTGPKWDAIRDVARGR